MQKMTNVWLSEINFKQYVLYIFFKFKCKYKLCYLIMAPDSEYKIQKNHNLDSYGIQFRLGNL